MTVFPVKLSFCIVFSLTAAFVSASDSNSVLLRLDDQHRNERKLSGPLSKPTLLFVADKKGSEQLEGWIAPLKSQLGGAVDFFAVADLRSVPSFLRGTVRRGFRREFAYPIALDWDGQAAEQLELAEDQANLFVLNRDGTVVHRQTGEAGEETLREVVAAVHALKSAGNSGDSHKQSSQSHHARSAAVSRLWGSAAAILPKTKVPVCGWFRKAGTQPRSAI